MSDETRTVTVESLAAALSKGEPGTQPINMFADPFDDADADDVAAAIFAALPVAEPDWEALYVEESERYVRLSNEYAALRGAAAQADGGETYADHDFRKGGYLTEDAPDNRCVWRVDGHSPYCGVVAAEHQAILASRRAGTWHWAAQTDGGEDR